MASLLGFFARLGNLVVVFVLCSFFALGLRFLALLFLDPGRGGLLLAGRLLGGLAFLASASSTGPSRSTRSPGTHSPWCWPRPWPSPSS